MKASPRHTARQKTVQALYAYRAGNSKPNTRKVAQIKKHLAQIDKSIEKAAPRWPINQINWVDLSILRLAAWELFWQPDTPPKVVINEAVELAKDFGDQNSAAFINAVLGTILKKINEK